MKNINLKDPHIIINCKTKLRKKLLLKFLTERIDRFGEVKDFKTIAPNLFVWCEINKAEAGHLLNELQYKNILKDIVTVNNDKVPIDELILICIILSYDSTVN